MRLLGKPTLDSEWGAGTGAALIAFCGIDIMEVVSVLFARAVRGCRRPGALVAYGTLVLLGRIRHVDRLLRSASLR